MSSDRDPLRLGADPETGPWLRSAISSAQAFPASAIDIDRLTARVEAAILAGPMSPDVAATAKAHLGGLSASKWVVVGVGLALGTALGTVWTLKNNAPRTATQSLATWTQSSAILEIQASSAPVPAPSSTPRPEGQASTSQAPTATKSNSTLRDTRASGLNEVALLDSARASLGTDPRRSLVLTQEHARRFPHSLLVQEREVIAIEALSRMGQTGAARARGNDFGRRYPGSAHQPKIDQTTRGQ